MAALQQGRQLRYRHGQCGRLRAGAVRALPRRHDSGANPGLAADCRVYRHVLVAAHARLPAGALFLAGVRYFYAGVIISFMRNLGWVPF